VVCPGRGTAWPATGRSGVERDCRAHERPCPARAARSGRHRGSQAVRHSQTFSRYAYRAAMRVRHQANISLGARPCAACGTTEPTGKAMLPEHVIRSWMIAMRTAHLHDLFGSLSPTTLLPLMTVSRLLTSGRAKRQALSTPSPGKPTRGPACRYLSLQFQTIQSCILCGYPVATTVQPRFAQECAYTSRNPAKPAARSHCRCDACHLARLRFGLRDF
jgi:hypothetical protein